MSKIIGLTMAQRTTKIINKILEKFLRECEKENLEMNEHLAEFIVIMIVRDVPRGINFTKYNDCIAQEFIESLVRFCSNASDPTILNLKMVYYYKNSELLEVQKIDEAIDKILRQRNKLMLAEIMQFSETSVKQQIENIAKRLIQYIISYYQLGSADNHVTNKIVRQTFGKIIKEADLAVNLLRKYEYRREYLEHLCAIVGGMLVYQNYGPTGEKEHLHDLFKKLETDLKNTKDALDSELARAVSCKDIGMQSLFSSLTYDLHSDKVMCAKPLHMLRQINKYIALYGVYERFIKQLLECHQRVSFCITKNTKMIECAIQRLDHIKKYKRSYEAESVYPHCSFISATYLKLWNNSYYLDLINKTLETLQLYCSKNSEIELINAIADMDDRAKQLMKSSNPVKHFNVIEHPDIVDREKDMFVIRADFQSYCTLTLGLTNGLLVKSTIQKRMCPDLLVKFGFRSYAFSRHAEKIFIDYVKLLRNAIHSSVDLILLFDIDGDIIMRHSSTLAKKKEPCKSCNISTQTDIQREEGGFSWANKLKATWNIWDLHRETMRMADLRKRQTKHTQSVLTYGQRHAQSQANAKKSPN